VTDPGQRECGCGADPPCKDLPPRVSAGIRHLQMFAQSSPCVLGGHRMFSEFCQSPTTSNPASSTMTKSLPRLLAVHRLRGVALGRVQSTSSRSWSGGDRYVVERLVDGVFTVLSRRVRAVTEK
jgi:hypothetical protein